MGERTVITRRTNDRGTGSRSGKWHANQNRVYGVELGARPLNREKVEERLRLTLKPLHLKVDVPFLITIITLLIVGLVILYSASYDYSRSWNGSPYFMITRQLMWLGVGIAALLFFAFFDYHKYTPFVVLALLGTIGLLVVVLFVNQFINNAERSILGGSIRPSELAKLVIVVYTSVWLFARKERLTQLSIGLIPLSIVMGVMGGFILAQPDLSAVVTVFALGTIVFFLAGGDLKQLGFLLLIALVTGFFVFQASATASKRMEQFWSGWQNPTGVSDHVRGASESFVNGSWFGTGLGKGEAKLLDLPVAPTDLIFAVVGEEFGVFGATVLVGLFVILLWRGLTIARNAPDQLGSLLAAGLSIWLALEAFVNMAVMLNVLPFAGNALPFISFGGSSLVACMAAVGIIMNVARQGVEKESESVISAIDHLRGRNRRRGVPRSNNISSP